MSWICPNCSHINEDDTERCLVCDAARPVGSDAPEKPAGKARPKKEPAGGGELKVIVSEEGEALKRKVYSGTPAPVRTKPVTAVRKDVPPSPKREEKERRKKAEEEELRRRREERERLRREEEEKKRREEDAEKKRSAEEEIKKRKEEKAAYRDEFEYHMWTFLGRSRRIGLAALGVALVGGIFTMGPGGLILEFIDNLRLLFGFL
ncbi:MAG: zinc finger Ran-binding domain-containing protein [Lachnospiraceae bacterium]|nr:zinc finger Ran-binding domain-containing protein [Lachnospiraceae bacterium]